MGYTHEWTFHPYDRSFNSAIERFALDAIALKKLVEAGFVLYDGKLLDIVLAKFEPHKILIQDSTGFGDHFYWNISHKNPGEFGQSVFTCSTLGKPYNILVLCMLLLMKMHFPDPVVTIRSNATKEDWGQAIRLLLFIYPEEERVSRGNSIYKYLPKWINEQ